MFFLFGSDSYFNSFDRLIESANLFIFHPNLRVEKIFFDF